MRQATQQRPSHSGADQADEPDKTPTRRGFCSKHALQRVETSGKILDVSDSGVATPADKLWGTLTRRCLLLICVLLH